MNKIIFKTLLLRGAQGERGEAGGDIPDDSVMYYEGATPPEGYVETDPPAAQGTLATVEQEVANLTTALAPVWESLHGYSFGEFVTYECELYRMDTPGQIINNTPPNQGNNWTKVSAGEVLSTIIKQIAREYVSNKNYRQGDIVYYKSKLYKCNHDGAVGNFQAYFDNITLADFLNSLMDNFCYYNAFIPMPVTTIEAGEIRRHNNWMYRAKEDTDTMEFEVDKWERVTVDSLYKEGIHIKNGKFYVWVDN